MFNPFIYRQDSSFGDIFYRLVFNLSSLNIKLITVEAVKLDD